MGVRKALQQDSLGSNWFEIAGSDPVKVTWSPYDCENRLANCKVLLAG